MYMFTSGQSCCGVGSLALERTCKQPSDKRTCTATERERAQVNRLDSFSVCLSFSVIQFCQSHVLSCYHLFSS